MTPARNVLDSMALREEAIRDHVAQVRPEQTWRYDAVARYYRRVAEAKRSGDQLAIMNFATIPELFWAMDVVPVTMDAISAMTTSSPEGASEYIDLCEQYFPDYLCATNKVSIGAMLANDLPMPDMIAHPSAPCDSAITAYPLIADHFGIPYFCIDIPYFRSERSHEYVKGEIRRLISFLEETTHRRLDMDKLREVMRYSGQAHAYAAEINKLVRKVPCPIRSNDVILDFGAVNALAGTPELVEYLKHRYETAKEMVDRKQGALPQEKLRMVWIYAMPVFDWSLFGWLEKKYGAVSISALNVLDVDPAVDVTTMDDMLSALAAKTVQMPMLRECGGPWEYYMDRVLQLCVDYKADAAIFGGHIACKHTWAIAKLIKDRLYDQLGVPTLTIEMDVFDPRVASLDSVKSQMDEFFDVLLQD